MFDAFIKFDGVEGESTDDKHSGWIEVLNYETGLTQKVSSTASSVGGASAERADFLNFSFQKELDKATPLISLACAAGTHIDKIVIELCRAGGDKVKFLEYKLNNCIISKVTTETGGAFPYDNISINYGKIEWCYTQQERQGGGAAGNVASGWDLQRKRKV